MEVSCSFLALLSHEASTLSSGDWSVQPFGEAAPPPARGAGASAIGVGAAGLFFLASAGGRVCEALLFCAPAGGAPAPPLGVTVAGVAVGGDPDEGGDDSSSSHNTDLSEEQELEEWVARPITRDAARGCHFHDALDTLRRQALDRRTWSIEYRCVVFQHSRGAYPDRREVTCLVHRPEDSLLGAEVCSEHYSISEWDSTKAAMQDAARRVLSHYCSVLDGVADGLDLRYYPRHPPGSTGGVIVSPVGEDNPRLSSTVNLAAVLNTKLYHALDKLSRAHAEIAQLRAECVERRHLADGFPTPRRDSAHVPLTSTWTPCLWQPRLQDQDKFRTIDRQCWIL
jgi:hypothetical protein